MKISYFFPIFKDDDAKTFFEKFLKGKFYNTHPSSQIILVVYKDDLKNLDYLKALSKKHANMQVYVAQKRFSFNSAYKAVLEYIDGDVLLLGDLKVPNIDPLFEKCIQKHEGGAKLVHIVKSYPKFKSFFKNIGKKIYNFFVRLFTSKTDACNITSLGLLDSSVVDILKTIPQKCIFLKNTKDHYMLPSSDVYVDYRVQSHEQSFRKTTFALKSAMTSAITFSLLLVFLVLFNTFVGEVLALNLVCILIEVALFIVFIMALPKHIFDCRNIVELESVPNLILLKQPKQVRAKKLDKKE